MINNNYYPVKYRDFLRMKEVGHYVIMYAELDDRIHFEMAVENAVYVTQRFLIDIENEVKEKGNNYDGDKIKMFLKMVLSGSTFYKYHPTEEMTNAIKKIKLYNKIIVQETVNGTYNADNVKVVETDDSMRAMDGDKVIVFGVKE